MRKAALDPLKTHLSTQGAHRSGNGVVQWRLYLPLAARLVLLPYIVCRVVWETVTALLLVL